MDRGLVTLVFVLAVLAAACSPTATGSSDRATKASPRLANATPYATVTIANRLAVHGSGSASSSRGTLKGDYVLRTSVKTKKGCRWSVRLQGPTSALLDSGSARRSATHRLTVNTLGVEQGDYRLVVKTSKCGAWSAALSRP